MDNREITVNIGNIQTQVFLQSGFFIHSSADVALHNHMMTEVQLVLEGTGEFLADGNTVKVCKNDMIVIPKECFHRRRRFENGSKILTFLTTLDTERFKKTAVKDWLVKELFSQIEVFVRYGDCIKLSLYIGLLLAEFYGYEKSISIPIQDRKLLIDEFFSKNYSRDIYLRDAAALLNLSEKQTERLIVKYMGTSFKKTLTRYRIEAASAIMAQEDIPLSKIAERVGYRSYSGFWKAYNQYK